MDKNQFRQSKFEQSALLFTIQDDDIIYSSSISSADILAFKAPFPKTIGRLGTTTESIGSVFAVYRIDDRENLSLFMSVDNVKKTTLYIGCRCNIRNDDSGFLVCISRTVNLLQ